MKLWDPIPGVAFSLGCPGGPVCSGNPLPAGDAPLLFVQLFYKTLWLLTVYLPLRAASRSTDLTQGFLIGIALEIIVIPWSYVFTHYIKNPGDRWR